MNIKPENLRTFVTVAGYGNLHEASEILGRTPSAISMSLKQLSEQLCAELFETDRKSNLTPTGQFVLEESRRALGSFDESVRIIQRYTQGKMGVVRVATVPSVASHLLPDVVSRFQKKAPEVRLELRDTDSVMVATAVGSGSVDCGVASLSFASQDLQHQLLLEEPFGLVCRPDHALAKSKQPLKWQALEDVTFISNGLCEQIRDEQFVRINSNTAIQVHNIVTLLGFIQQGMGVTLLPRLAVPDHGELCFLPLADKSAVRQLYFLEPKHHRMSPAGVVFKQQVIQSFSY